MHLVNKGYSLLVLTSSVLNNLVQNTALVSLWSGNSLKILLPTSWKLVIDLFCDESGSFRLVPKAQLVRNRVRGLSHQVRVIRVFSDVCRYRNVEVWKHFLCEQFQLYSMMRKAKTNKKTSKTLYLFKTNTSITTLDIDMQNKTGTNCKWLKFNFFYGKTSLSQNILLQKKESRDWQNGLSGRACT